MYSAEAVLSLNNKEHKWIILEVDNTSCYWLCTFTFSYSGFSIFLYFRQVICYTVDTKKKERSVYEKLYKYYNPFTSNSSAKAPAFQ